MEFAFTEEHLMIRDSAERFSPPPAIPMPCVPP
jgi:hypothetical protein